MTGNDFIWFSQKSQRTFSVDIFHRNSLKKTLNQYYKDILNYIPLESVQKSVFGWKRLFALSGCFPCVSENSTEKEQHNFSSIELKPCTKKMRIPRWKKLHFNSKNQTKKKKIPTAVRKTEKSLKRNKRKCLKGVCCFHITASLSLTRVSIQPFDISSSFKRVFIF